MRLARRCPVFSHRFTENVADVIRDEHRRVDHLLRIIARLAQLRVEFLGRLQSFILLTGSHETINPSQTRR